MNSREKDKGRLSEEATSATLSPDELLTPPRTSSGEGGVGARGSSVNRFIIVDLLGEGGMGTVYSAYDPALDRRVAIKILHNSDSAAGRARMVREAQAMATINHRNVVTIFDTGEFEERIYVAMEYLEGGTLQERIESLRNEGRADWRQVLELMIPAGRGLAAAHNKGLVHRDFKPENVLVSEKGEVKVADFGLVSLSLRGEDEKGELPDLRKVTIEDRLTREGALMGTPSYMAPEHFDGEPLDARADQYGYGVVLYEALYGQLPFKGKTLFELASHIKKGELEANDHESDVPAWLRRAVLRCLRADPDERFDSMDELLDELAQDHDIRKRRMAYAAVAVVALVGAGVAGMLLQSEKQAALVEEPCKASAEAWVGIWDEEVKASTQRAFEATGADYASSVWKTVSQGLDDYTRDWSTANEQACLDTHVHNNQSVSLLDQRMACFDGLKSDLSALVLELKESDAETLPFAVFAVQELGGVEQCSRSQVVATASTSSDGIDESTLEDLRSRLRKARTAGGLGKFDEGMELADEAGSEALDLGLNRLAAQAELLLGRLHWKKGELSESVDSLVEAAGLAERASDPMIRLGAYTELVYVLGWELARPDEALRWAKVAESLVAELGEEGPAKARLIQHIAAAEFKAQNYELSRIRLEASQSAFEALGDSLAAGRSELALGNLEHIYGNYDQALAHYQAVQKTRAEALGEHHPELSEVLSNIGACYMAVDKVEDARAALDQALGIARKGLGDSHPDVADALNNLGTVDLAEEKLSSALERFQQSLSISELALGETHPDVGVVLSNIGVTYQHLQNYQASIEHFERALEVFGNDTRFRSDAANAKYLLAQSLVAKKKELPRARDLAMQAIMMLEEEGADEGELDAMREWLDGLSR